MIDLTSENVDELIKKYISVLELAKDNEQIPYLAVVINTAVNHIKEKYNDLNIDWKCWCTILVRTQYLNNKINSKKDVTETIDNFITYWKENYNNYCNDIIFSDVYDRDRGFVYGYAWKKNK